MVEQTVASPYKMELFRSVVHGEFTFINITKFRHDLVILIKVNSSALLPISGFPSQLEIIFISLYLLWTNASIALWLKDSPIVSGAFRLVSEIVAIIAVTSSKVTPANLAETEVL